MNLYEIFEFNENAKKSGAAYTKHRYILEEILSEKGKHFIGISGPRGTGKTVLLRQLLNIIPESFYISADTSENINLLEIAKILSNQNKIKVLLIDEIHFCKSYPKDLKKIYDFLDIKIIFTSSVSLSLFSSEFDLSRRVKIIKLYPFSFREFLYFENNLKISKISIDDIVNSSWKAEHMMHLHLFDDYLKGRLFPFTLEEPNFMPLVHNICKKVIHKDIPIVANLRLNEISKISKLLEFIGKSEVDGINYSSISKNIGITKYKAEQYVKLLSNAFVLNVVFPMGTNVLKEPKVLMNLPYRLIYKDFDQCIGALREDFFVESAKMRGLMFHYLKTTRGSKTPDYLIVNKNEKIVIEIGGKGKGRTQFKGIKAEKKLILSHSLNISDNQRHLSLFGFI